MVGKGCVVAAPRAVTRCLRGGPWVDLTTLEAEDGLADLVLAGPGPLRRFRLP